MKSTISLSDFPATPARAEPMRPLGEVSDFVTEKMPALLAGIHSGTLDTREYVQTALNQASRGLNDIVPIVNFPSHRMNSLAHLDACMLRESVLAHDDAANSEVLDALVRRTANLSNSAPALTYEGVIYANPITEDPRTFSEGNDAQAEMLFYECHRRIERNLAQTLFHLSALLRSSAGSREKKAFVYESLVPAIERVTADMGNLLVELPEESFGSFRRYFSPSSRRNLKGPSGLFSAGVYALDAYCIGNHPAMESFQAGKLADESYYPSTTILKHDFAGRADMHEADQAVREGQTLLSSNIPSALAEVASQILKMRKVHFGIASKFVMKHLGAEIGTAGKNIREFLQRPINAYMDVAQISR